MRKKNLSYISDTDINLNEWMKAMENRINTSVLG